MSVRYGIEGNDTKDDDQVQNTNADVYYSTETEYSLGKQNSLTYNYSFDWGKKPTKYFYTIVLRLPVRHNSRPSVCII